jgi:peptide/nickel transport system permease protein/oligopeptide transport system permease protein
MASLSADAWRDLRRNPVFWIASGIVLLMLLLAAFPGLFTRIGPGQAFCSLSDSLRGSSGAHWFGFDKQGCDVYVQVVYGARASVMVGIFSTLLTGLIAVAVGLPAGYYGGWVDGLLARCTDIVLGIPLLLGAVVVAVALSGRELGIWPVVLAVGLLGWPTAARVVRASVIAAKHQDYVQAARVLGASHARIMLRHILPNSLAPVVVVLTILLGQFIALEATLSFLGVSPRGTVSWGVSIAESKDWVSQSMLPLLFPAGFLTATVLAFIMLGDAVRDAFDPKLR